jgi:hypothetical protein
MQRQWIDSAMAVRSDDTDKQNGVTKASWQQTQQNWVPSSVGFREISGDAKLFHTKTML